MYRNFSSTLIWKGVSAPILETQFISPVFWSKEYIEFLPSPK
jgi:hypothetical protein